MRRYVVLLVVMAIVVSGSLVALAQSDEPNNDGKVIWQDIGEYNNLDWIPTREPEHKDVNPVNSEKVTPLENQKVQKKMLAKAWIPCYIRMEIRGNTGYNILESYGPDVVAQDTFRAQLWFDNEIGGFFDENWNWLGSGKNLEIAPGDDKFIFACDQLIVKVFANDEYIYEIQAAPLTPVDAPVTGGFADPDLDLYMRYRCQRQGQAETGWTSYIFDGTVNPDIVQIPDTHLEACEEIMVRHEFMVPYFRTTAHGHYAGEVYFRAYIL